MKSRTSCFKTALKKDFTRFAPAWILYTICLLLGLVLMSQSAITLSLPRSMAECIQLMSIVNLGYGLLTAQLLFGDLFNSRLCFGLHTLPLRRESWFAVHVLSGCLFSLIPTAIMAGISLPLNLMSAMENGWQISLYWLLGVNLEYLFFFGVGVFSMLCAGNRFGSALVYVLIQFGALLGYYVVDALYTPMLYGISTRQGPFLLLCPVAQFVEFPFIGTEMERLTITPGSAAAWRGTFTLSENWWYLWVCAGVGLVLMAAALLLYRKRDLERCGDLMATRKLNPVFLTLFSLACAIMAHLFLTIFGLREKYWLLFAGLAVGYFAGLMLLSRSTRVFRLRNWPGLLLLAAGLGLSLWLTHMDVLKLETKIPDKDSIASVTVCQNLYGYGQNERNSACLTDAEDIENVLYIHEQALQTRLDSEALWYQGGPVSSSELPDAVDWDQVGRATYVVLHYRLKDGDTLTRSYYIWGHQKEGLLLRQYLSDVKAVTGYSSLGYSPVQHFSINGFEVPQEARSREDIEALLEAIEADCAAGLLAQDPGLHPLDNVLTIPYEDGAVGMHAYWLSLTMEGQTIRISVYSDSSNTLLWITDRQLDELVYSLELAQYY